MDFIPYGRQSVDEDDIKAVTEVLRGSFLTTGPKIAEFENALCAATGAKYAVAVSNGTSALHLASLAILHPGDRVLTTPNSFVATSNAIIYAGAEPVFCDICPDGNIDLDMCGEILKKDKSIRAIYAVNFSGNPVGQTKLAELKERYGVLILEDCAHSLGAQDGGMPSGMCAHSDCAAFSFHPVKHITTGEGGAITTSSGEIYKKLLSLRAHGITRDGFVNTDMAYDEHGNRNPWYYEMTELGFNYRITDIQCALDISQISRLGSFAARRRALAQRYEEFFAGTAVRPLYRYDGRSSYHLYVCLADFGSMKVTRAELFNRMRAAGVGLQLHYIPINKQPYYRSLGYGGEHTPVMDGYYASCFSMPMYFSLTDNEQEYAVKKLLEIVNE